MQFVARAAKSSRKTTLHCSYGINVSAHSHEEWQLYFIRVKFAALERVLVNEILALISVPMNDMISWT